MVTSSRDRMRRRASGMLWFFIQELILLNPLTLVNWDLEIQWSTCIWHMFLMFFLMFLKHALCLQKVQKYKAGDHFLLLQRTWVPISASTSGSKLPITLVPSDHPPPSIFFLPTRSEFSYHILLQTSKHVFILCGYVIMHMCEAHCMSIMYTILD